MKRETLDFILPYHFDKMERSFKLLMKTKLLYTFENDTLNFTEMLLMESTFKHADEFVALSLSLVSINGSQTLGDQYFSSGSHAAHPPCVCKPDAICSVN